MLYHLTWQPNDVASPETLTVDLSTAFAARLQRAIANPEAAGTDVVQIPTRAEGDAEGAPFQPRLFRVARIIRITRA